MKAGWIIYKIDSFPAAEPESSSVLCAQKKGRSQCSLAMLHASYLATDARNRQEPGFHLRTLPELHSALTALNFDQQFFLYPYSCSISYHQFFSQYEFEMRDAFS